jgi:hypothetical protein
MTGLLILALLSAELMRQGMGRRSREFQQTKMQDRRRMPGAALAVHNESLESELLGLREA